MKFATDRIDCGKVFGWTTEHGDPVVVEVPLGAVEGFFQELAAYRGNNEDGTPRDPGSRLANLLLLDKVLNWNIDGPDGTTLPLTRTIDPNSKGGPEKRLAVLGLVPIQLFPELARRLTNPQTLSERAEAFSKTSSEA